MGIIELIEDLTFEYHRETYKDYLKPDFDRF